MFFGGLALFCGGDVGKQGSLVAYFTVNGDRAVGDDSVGALVPLHVSIRQTDCSSGRRTPSAAVVIVIQSCP